MVTQIHRMSIDGMEFVIPTDFEELLEALVEADGTRSAIQVYSTKMENIFEEAGLIKKNIRGSCYGTKKLKDNLESLVEAYYKIMPDAKL